MRICEIITPAVEGGDSQSRIKALRARLAEVEAQRDMMKGALEKIADSRRYGECSRLLGEIRVCAREALAKLEAHDGK